MTLRDRLSTIELGPRSAGVLNGNGNAAGGSA